jgi:CRP-like cAMP-binding protein
MPSAVRNPDVTATLEQLHQENHMLASLPREALDRLRPALREISPPNGTVLLEPGEDIQNIYFPRTGMVSLLVSTADGHMIETATVGREGAVGLQRGLGPRLSFTRATVQIAGRLTVVGAQRFEEAVQSAGEIRLMIEQYIEMQWAESQQLSACNAIHDASSRLCRWLLQCADRVQGTELALTQDFLAQMLGVRRTTVTMLAQEMQRKGSIRYVRGKIQVLDRAALESCACDCYRAIQQDRLPDRIGIVL